MITCLSVSPPITRVDQSKVVEVMICIFLPYSSPILLVFGGQVLPKNSMGSLPVGRQTSGMGKTSYFLALCINIVKMVRDTSKVTIN